MFSPTQAHGSRLYSIFTASVRTELDFFDESNMITSCEETRLNKVACQNVSVLDGTYERYLVTLRGYLEANLNSTPHSRTVLPGTIWEIYESSIYKYAIDLAYHGRLDVATRID